MRSKVKCFQAFFSCKFLILTSVGGVSLNENAIFKCIQINVYVASGYIGR